MDWALFVRLGWSAVISFAIALPANPSSQNLPQPDDHPRATIEVRQCRLRLIDEVRLASERSGILVEIVAPGTTVPAGGVVARLRDSAAQASYAVAEKEATNDIEVRFSRKASELAQMKYQRAMEADRALAGTVTEFELSELRLAAEKSLLQMEQADHQLQIAELRRLEQYQTLHGLQVETPFEAFVRTTHKKPGEFVREGETVAEVVSTGRFRIEAYVDAQFLANVGVGDRVRIEVEQSTASQTAATSLQPFAGLITFVDVKIEPVSSKFLIWAETQHTGNDLHDGQSVVLTINP